MNRKISNQLFISIEIESKNNTLRRSNESMSSSLERGRRQQQPQKEYIKHITKDLIRDILYASYFFISLSLFSNRNNFIISPYYRVPEEPGAKSLVIDRATYDRLLKACNFKTKEELEDEKRQLDTERDQLLVRFLHFFD